ncbi:MAG: DUF6671 family protein [Cuspidothrix sp.]
MIKQLFHNRVAVIATMHHKEKVIAPILKESLGINIIVPENFNSDIFGTFTREIKRPDKQIATAKLKAKQALLMTGETIAIASEGSFSPHPSFPFIYANREVIVFLDQELDLEIIGEVFSTETNFNHQVINSLLEAEEFASRSGFPDHGLVVWFDKNDQQEIEIIKGINTKQKLADAVKFGLNNSLHGKLHIETDMRALHNPTRMKNIGIATQDLVQKINSQCPQCLTLGFTITDKIPGLPCQICSYPSSLTLAVVYKCKKCGFQQQKLFPNGQQFADPSLCEYCNP